jgi:hypothetical protein
MRALLERERAAGRLADAVDLPLAALARRNARASGATARLVFSAAYLVAAETVDEFRAEVERIQRDHPELTLVCTGPWPPYSFAALDGAVGEAR